ncbi:hypothetical protein PR202_ga13010 [Eleusine coracana subsp. coracana]|uniref:Uncharacterized protein n=1 Tax=Eleusine coracana subsp. coracana TaxID=191504 RepID=A0AAV5CD76_ELECO|nr:hypothetical protein PR202_ga13010 [Eleusine coracana subsp. coracana]
MTSSSSFSSPSRKVPNPNTQPAFLASTQSGIRALTKIACNRLQKEFAEWQVNPPAGFKHRVTDNLQRCPPGLSFYPIDQYRLLVWEASSQS